MHCLVHYIYIYIHPLQHIPSPLKDSQRPHWTLFSGSIHRWIGRITPGRGIYHDIGRSQEIFRGHGRIGAISWRKPPTNAISVPMRFSGIWHLENQNYVHQPGWHLKKINKLPNNFQPDKIRERKINTWYSDIRSESQLDSLPQLIQFMKRRPHDLTTPFSPIHVMHNVHAVASTDTAPISFFHPMGTGKIKPLRYAKHHSDDRPHRSFQKCSVPK